MMNKLPYLFSSRIANVLKIAFTIVVIAFVIYVLLINAGFSSWQLFGIILLAFDLARVVWGKSGPVWWFIEIIVWRGVMEYGTSPRRAFSLIAVLWALSISVYKDQGQIEIHKDCTSPSVNNQSKAKMLEAKPKCLISDWGLNNALFLSLRYHIPMFSIDAKNNYTLKETGNVNLNLPLVTTHSLPLTAAEYGALMKLLNSLLWPIAIALFIRWAIVGQSH